MDKKFYRENRAKLLEMLPDGCMAVLSSGYTINRSADEDYDFTVNNNFFYLTGIRQAEVHLVMIKDGTPRIYLYIDEYDEKYAKWIGHRITVEEAADISGVENIRYKGEFDEDIKDYTKRYHKVYLDLEKGKNINYNSFGLSLAEKLTNNEICDLYPLVVEMRSAKAKCEIELMEQAIDATKKGVEELMANSKAGMTEYQLEAYFDFSIKQNGNLEHAFKTIAASGNNATTLHYSANNSMMNNGDLILFDLGAKVGGYCADISRTFPVNGKFTPLQRTIYDIVLTANKKIASVARAGMTVGELQEICVRTLTKGCMDAGLIKTPEELKKYYFHGVSHSIGLDTHDPHDRNEPLPVGAVISDEPGLYFPQYGIGVRIEDDLYLLKTKAVNLSANIIKEIDDIEDFMAKNNA